MKKKKPDITVHDLAAKLKLNASTVSRALNNHPRISDATKKRVLDMAQKYNYKLNRAAYTLRTGKGKTIGVIVPRVNRFFFSNVIQGIEEVVAGHDHNVIIAQSLDSTKKEKSAIEALLSQKVDGIIASITPDVNARDAYSECCENYQTVIDAHTPLVFFNMVCENFNVSKVVIDDELGGFVGTEHLIKEGARKVAILAGYNHMNIYRRRLEGYKQALKHFQLEVNTDLIKFGHLTEEVGYNCARELMEQKDQPDAIFAVTDYLAIGAIRYLKANGFALPEQIRVGGFMNEPFNDLLEPSLTSIEQHSYEMGRISAEMLMQQIKNAGKPFIPQKTVLAPQLIIRHSSSKTANLVTGNDG